MNSRYWDWSRGRWARSALRLLQRRVFDFPAQPEPYYLWWALPLGGMLVLSLLGTLLGARLVQRKGRLGQDLAWAFTK